MLKRLFLCALTLCSPTLYADTTFLPIQGKLAIDTRNISGLVVTDQFAVLATDEGRTLQVLTHRKEHYLAEPQGAINLTDHNTELDLEGLAWQAPYLYAIGSHSRKRKKIKDNASDVKNLKRLSQIIHEPDRHQLFQLELSAHGTLRAIRSLSLDKWISGNTILAPFSALPSKENGIDIEGIAVEGDKLYVGFRGPVLRGNLTPILQFKLNQQTFTLKKPELKLVNLGGLGIRDMAANQGQLWLLAGPVNEIPHQFELLNWPGQHAFTPLKPAQTLNGDWLTHKPEAIAFDARYPQQFWLGQDGTENGTIRLLPLTKP